MPPLRRSARLRRTKAAMPEEERIYTREKKRREISHIRSPSADMDLPLKTSGIWSDDSQLQLNATTQLLNMVSLEHKPQIDKVVQSCAVPRLVEFLGRDDYPQLQLEAARVLKNITSGTSENTKVVTDCGAVPVFVKLLGSSELETCEQVVWSLGNIAGESSWFRNIVLSCGGLHPLLSLLEKHSSLSFLRIGAWSLANIFEEGGGPIVPFEQLEFAIRVLASLTLTNDEAVLKEACWALLHLSQRGGGIETTMYEADLIAKLVSLIEHAPLPVLYPAVQAIRSILTGTTKLDKRALLPRRQVLGSTRLELSCPHIRKEVHSLSDLMAYLYPSIFDEMRREERRELGLS